MSKNHGLLSPILIPGPYVFCTSTDIVLSPKMYICSFREKEGVTYVLTKENADQSHLNYDSIWSWISLDFVSDLEMVGLTAKMSTALASEGISCNIIAAFYHDHLFVPQDRAVEAMKILEEITI